LSVDLVLILVCGCILALGLPSNVTKRLWLSVPLLVVVAGVLLGPEVLVRSSPAGSARSTRCGGARPDHARGVAGRHRPADDATDLRTNWRRAGLAADGRIGRQWLLTSLGAWLVLGLPVRVALLLGRSSRRQIPSSPRRWPTGGRAEANLPRRLRHSLQLRPLPTTGSRSSSCWCPRSCSRCPATTSVPSPARRSARSLFALGIGRARLRRREDRHLAEDHQATSGGFFLVSRSRWPC